ncbi:hypothetical protein VKI21_06705 [Cyanobacterium aponinum UTEX 3222]|uniref:hypothetical protein n=1 Tax=Cyanobacterium aponinum TaxID=379064 RepID=UPI002B4BAFE5|nr:hypothetical protein [Cyanobacterium aponinum]WRL37033.1 hypothetical protein VKI22_10360 [Cyanobacterium aponinum UTEX 3221]WRL43367.1 hypothetical protein VKI21_06705 [Cyanobacterium aponinum UTEX 3222]
MSELEEIYKKFHEINIKLKKLEKKADRIIVTGGKLNKQPKQINITLEELINIYNYIPQILSEYATPVSLSAKTYREKIEEIELDYQHNGYYWVILLENQGIKNYYLLPNGNIKVNFARLQNYINFVFILHGNFLDIGNNFSLIRCATIDILPNGLSWILKAKGEIISKISPSDLLLKELVKFQDKDKQIPDNISKLLDLLDSYYNETLKIKDRLYIESENIIELEEKFVQLNDIFISNNRQVYSLIDVKEKSILERVIQMNEQLSDKIAQQDKQIRGLRSNIGCLNFLVFILVLFISFFLWVAISA